MAPSPRPRSHVAEDGNAAAEDHRDDAGHEGEFQRRRQPLAQQLHDIAVQRDGNAEVAVQEAAKPDDELGEERLVEAVAGA